MGSTWRLNMQFNQCVITLGTHKTLFYRSFPTVLSLGFSIQDAIISDLVECMGFDVQAARVPGPRVGLYSLF